MNEQEEALDRPAESPVDHGECVPADWSHRTHNHEGVPGAWLFPEERP